MMEKDGRTVAVLQCMTCQQTDFTAGNPKASLEEQIGELGKHGRSLRHAVQFIPGGSPLGLRVDPYAQLEAPVSPVPRAGPSPVAATKPSVSDLRSATPSPSPSSSAPWRPAHTPARPHTAASPPEAVFPSTTLSLDAVSVLADGDDD